MSEILPCGACDIGVYAVACYRNGVEAFAGCQSRRDALRAAPRCKANPKRICMGARDFAEVESFPLDVARINDALDRC